MKVLNTSLALVTGWVALTSAATAGTITGYVHAEGKSDPALEAACGKYDSHAFKFVQRMDYSAMHDFVVYIDGPVGTNAATAEEKPVTVFTQKISQHKAIFVPHVLPVLKNTVVTWPNNDDIFHNVFSYSDTQSFDLGLYKNPEVKSVKFDKPGRVDVFCSIHASMSCVVLVLENPFFASTNERGNYSISNVPPGTYTLKAWHERLPVQKQQITVPADGNVKVDFTLGISGLPKI